MTDQMFGVNVEGFVGKKWLKHCPERKCFVTKDKHLLREANALLFPWLYTRHDTPIPDRLPGQAWVFMTMESPSTDTYLIGNVDERTKLFDNLFDISMTYRRDSDIYLPYFTLNLTAKNSSTDVDLIDKVRRKTKMAAWFVTNRLAVSSDRNRIVEELKADGVQIDVYGPGKQICPKTHREKCYMIVDQHYKFYLSFENSICKDYVTEKFFWILQLDVVPVVLGGANYSLFAPKNSFIDVSDFTSISELAAYLRMLDQNDELYMEYFKWKRDVNVTLKDPAQDMFCELCRRLSTNESHKPYANLKNWWYDDQCMYDQDKLSRSKINAKFEY